MSLPADWTDQVYRAIKSINQENSGSALFGLTFPEAWKGELLDFVRNGEVRRMFNIKAVSFGGTSIEALAPPDEKKDQATKPLESAPKRVRKAG